MSHDESENEAQIIRRVCGGDTDAFRWIVERYQGPVYTLAYNLTADHHEAQDVAQDAFIAAFRALGNFDPRRSAFSTWLFTIARNRCLNVLRARKLRAISPVPPTAATGANPPREAGQRELNERLDLALAQLPLEQKTAFVLAELMGLSAAEIAAIEQVAEGTVRSRVSRARSTLQQQLRHFQESQT